MAEGDTEDNTDKRMYHMTAGYPKFHGFPKINKKDITLRPLVSSRGTTTYRVAKELARILRPLIGKYPHHFKNTKYFM